MRFRSAGLLFVSFVVAATAARAETVQCTELTTVPHVISAPGVYCFKTSITYANGGPGQTALVIASDDVVLDLNGHVLQADAAGRDSIGIGAWNRKNVTVRNGTVRGFRHGILFEDEPPYARAEGYVVERIRAEHIRWTAITVEGKGNIVRDNHVLFTGPVTGDSIKYTNPFGILVGGSGASVTDNKVVDTIAPEGGSATGIAVLAPFTVLAQAVGATVERNFVGNESLASGPSYGIQLFGTKGAAVGNRVVNMKYGIWFSGQGMYMDNIVAGAAAPYGGFAVAAGNTNFSY